MSDERHVGDAPRELLNHAESEEHTLSLIFTFNTPYLSINGTCNTGTSCHSEDLLRMRVGAPDDSIL